MFKQFRNNDTIKASKNVYSSTVKNSMIARKDEQFVVYYEGGSVYSIDATSGKKFWIYNPGKGVDRTRFFDKVDITRKLTVAEIETLLGFKVRVVADYRVVDGINVNTIKDGSTVIGLVSWYSDTTGNRLVSGGKEYTVYTLNRGDLRITDRFILKGHGFDRTDKVRLMVPSRMTVADISAHLGYNVEIVRG